MTAPSDTRLILLGQITGAHGIRGDVIVRTYTGEPADIAAYGPLTDKAGGRPLTLHVVRASGKGVVARVKGVSDRNAAEALKGLELYVARAKLPKADEAEYYHADLIGLAAVTPEGQDLGRIIAVQNYGAGDLLEIKMTASGDTDFIPFTNACVPDVDLAAGRVTVVMPEVVGEAETTEDDSSESEDG